MRRSDIERENCALLDRQRQFRSAADVVTDAWMAFLVVRAIAVIGSVARPLWKEVPRFHQYRSRAMSYGMNAVTSTLPSGWTRSMVSTLSAGLALARFGRCSKPAPLSASSATRSTPSVRAGLAALSRASVLLQSMPKRQAGLPRLRMRRHSVQQGDRWLRPP